MPIDTNFQEINTSTPNDGQGDTLFVGGNAINSNWQKEADNLDFIDENLNNIRRIIDVSLAGTDPQKREIERVADAINAMPSFVVTAREIPEFRLSTILYQQQGGVLVYFQQTYYGLVGRARGLYGTGPGATITADDLVRLRENSGRPETYALGNIGTDNVWDVVNTTGPYIVSGTTIFTAEQNSVEKTWLFVGPPGVYGDGEDQTVAAYFQDITAEDALPGSDDLPPKEISTATHTLEADDLNRLLEFTDNNPTLTLVSSLVPEVTSDGILSVKTRAEFRGTGTMTIDYEDDGTPKTLELSHGDVAIIEHRLDEADGWIVYIDNPGQVKTAQFTYTAPTNAFTLPKAASEVLAVFIGQAAFYDAAHITFTAPDEVVVDGDLLLGGEKILIMYKTQT